MVLLSALSVLIVSLWFVSFWFIFGFFWFLYYNNLLALIAHELRLNLG